MSDTKDLSLLADITPEQKALLKNTVAKGLDDNEFLLFLSVCKARNLHPLLKQVYPVKYKDRKTGQYVLNFITSIDTYRLIAQRSKEMDGHKGPYWCAPDGKWVDIWTSNEPPFAAKIFVHRKGCLHPFEGIARWSAYAKIGDEGRPEYFWQKMGPEQLAKCAEALALRKAFPQELAGLYTREEMEQADNPIDVTPRNGDLQVKKKPEIQQESQHETLRPAEQEVMLKASNKEIVQFNKVAKSGSEIRLYYGEKEYFLADNVEIARFVKDNLAKPLCCTVFGRMILEVTLP